MKALYRRKEIFRYASNTFFKIRVIRVIRAIIISLHIVRR